MNVLKHLITSSSFQRLTRIRFEHSKFTSRGISIQIKQILCPRFRRSLCSIRTMNTYQPSQVRKSAGGQNAISLCEVVKRFEEKAPTYLAESWDNVGLLVEPSAPHTISKILLTNDLTEKVLEEALTEGANMIFSYHPPIFVPLKRLVQKSVKERIIVKCIENRIAVYSPHTIYDALEDGVNYWLSNAFGSRNICKRMPVSGKTSNKHLCDGAYKLELTLRNEDETLVRHKLKHSVSKAPMVTLCSYDEIRRLSYNVTANELEKAIRLIREDLSVSVLTEVIQLHKPPLPGAGIGLIFEIEAPVNLGEALGLVKQHIGLEHLRLSVGKGHSMESSIQTVACCAGSGSSVLRGTKADLYLTGEMSHHELLDATSKGTSVILCEHSNSERGFLKTLMGRFSAMFSDSNMEVVVSSADKDPVVIV